MSPRRQLSDDLLAAFAAGGALTDEQERRLDAELAEIRETIRPQLTAQAAGKRTGTDIVGGIREIRTGTRRGRAGTAELFDDC